MIKLDYTLRNYTLVCRIVLFGTYLGIVTLSALLWADFVFVHNPLALSRLMICAIAFMYISIAHLLSHLNHYHCAAYLLVLFYILLAATILWNWGIDTPIGILMFGLVIVLAGILLSARHALIALIVSGTILAGMQTANLLNWHQPDNSWVGSPSNFGDVLGYCTIFSMLALVSWLYNREMERSLTSAQQAGVALQQQKASLKTLVKERTTQLRRVQLQEMQQMYRFSELGQQGIILLHDLANHLTVLTLEIEGIHSKQHTKAIERAQRVIAYLDNIVASTRERLSGNTEQQTFSLVEHINKVIAFLDYRTAKTNVTIDWQPPIEPMNHTGDPASFRQIIAIIAGNAVDSYIHSKTTSAGAQRVLIEMHDDRRHIIITISDWGRGITKTARKHLFKPHRSSKRSGLGLGLYIARQTIEMQFSGTLTLGPHDDHTQFIITLPRTNAG